MKSYLDAVVGGDKATAARLKKSGRVFDIPAGTTIKCTEARDDFVRVSADQKKLTGKRLWIETVHLVKQAKLIN